MIDEIMEGMQGPHHYMIINYGQSLERVTCSIFQRIRVTLGWLNFLFLNQKRCILQLRERVPDLSRSSASACRTAIRSTATRFHLKLFPRQELLSSFLAKEEDVEVFRLLVDVLVFVVTDVLIYRRPHFYFTDLIM